ncbi:MAG: IS4 family transposase [Thermomicrobiales bacterium]|nr:IS4 family transposase [Thermomicrobiales bacterium]
MPCKNPARRFPTVHARDHARSRATPTPSAEEFDAHLTLLIYPVALGIWSRARGAKLRERVLSLPVMVGILLSLVWRQIPSVTVLKQMLTREPLLWVEPTTVSQQAISQRLNTLPAALFAQLFAELIPSLRARAAQRPAFHAELLAALAPAYQRVWILDSSRLEAVFKKSKAVRATDGTVLGGTLVTVLDLGSHLPVQVWVDPSATVNDRKSLPKLQACTPSGTIVVLDRGFSTFASFDALTEAGSAVVGRWTANWTYEVVETLSSSATHLDQLVRLGRFRSSPCQHPVRRIGRLDQKQWHWWVTTEPDPERISAEQVIALFTQRWRIEDAFLQCKRLLHLSYLWGSTANAIALQVWTTVLLYAMLVDLCGELGQALAVSAERISVELTFRSLYHYARACQQGETRGLIAWLSDPAQGDLGLVKRHRARLARRQGQNRCA